jgi:hypothetical protein
VADAAPEEAPEAALGDQLQIHGGPGLRQGLQGSH